MSGLSIKKKEAIKRSKYLSVDQIPFCYYEDISMGIKILLFLYDNGI